MVFLFKYYRDFKIEFKRLKEIRISYDYWKHILRLLVLFYIREKLRHRYVNIIRGKLELFRFMFWNLNYGIKIENFLPF